MSVTGFVFLMVYAAGLVLAFWKPMFGLCAYLWAFYNNPPSAWWGSQLPDLRWSLIAAVVTLIAYALHSLATAHGAEPRAGVPSYGAVRDREVA